MSEENKQPATDPCPPAKSAVDPQLILSRLKDPQTLSKINYILAQHGITTSKPWLKLEMEAAPDQQALELETEDLQKLFSAFGPVESIVVSPHQRATAMVLFKDIVSAYLAQQALNNYYVPAYSSRLLVKWALSGDPAETASFDRVGAAVNPLVEVQQENMCVPEDRKVPQPSQYFVPQTYPDRSGKAPENMSVTKYTCRFDIQIVNDKEFQVARKLIGAKGSNMKRILDLCSKGCTCPVQDVIKLRLRGRGSGFKEGPSQQESDDPLHLCISSRFYDKYVMARQLARELILDVYDDHKRFCERTGKAVVSLQIKLTENVSGNRGRHPPPHGKGRSMYYGQPAPGYYYEGARGENVPPPQYYQGTPAGYGGRPQPYYGYDTGMMYRSQPQYDQVARGGYPSAAGMMGEPQRGYPSS